MVNFVLVENNVYKLNYILTETIPTISECANPACDYNRSVTSIREKFEMKILNESSNRANMNILFFGCYLLGQEFRILQMLHDKISEIHLTDYVYRNLSDDVINALNEFMAYIDLYELNIDVYVHTDPFNLVNCASCKNHIDMICGIDIDTVNYPHESNRQLLKLVAKHTLKPDGIMIISQNYQELIDLCVYKPDANGTGTLELVSLEDYVKKPYYFNFKLRNLFYHAYDKLNYVGIIFSGILIKKFWPLALVVCVYNIYMLSRDRHKLITSVNNYDDLIQ